MKGMNMDVYSQKLQNKAIYRIRNLYVGPVSLPACPPSRQATRGTPLSSESIFVIDVEESTSAHFSEASPSRATRKRQVSNVKMPSADRD